MSNRLRSILDWLQYPARISSWLFGVLLILCVVLSLVTRKVPDGLVLLMFLSMLAALATVPIVLLDLMIRRRREIGQGSARSAKTVWQGAAHLLNIMKSDTKWLITQLSTKQALRFVLTVASNALLAVSIIIVGLLFVAFVQSIDVNFNVTVGVAIFIAAIALFVGTIWFQNLLDLPRPFDYTARLLTFLSRSFAFGVPVIGVIVIAGMTYAMQPNDRGWMIIIAPVLLYYIFIATVFVATPLGLLARWTRSREEKRDG